MTRDMSMLQSSASDLMRKNGCSRLSDLVEHLARSTSMRPTSDTWATLMLYLDELHAQVRL